MDEETRKPRVLIAAAQGRELIGIRQVSREDPVHHQAVHTTAPGRHSAAGSVDLVVTSPPFLDVVDYAADNWLRCWFAGIAPESVALTTPRGLDGWRDVMTSVFHELFRVVRPGGSVAFEVGEQVKVIDCPFSDFNGVVEEIRPEKGTLKVSISIFGRSTSVEMELVQVEKV